MAPINVLPVSAVLVVVWDDGQNLSIPRPTPGFLLLFSLALSIITRLVDFSNGTILRKTENRAQLQ